MTLRLDDTTSILRTWTFFFQRPTLVLFIQGFSKNVLQIAQFQLLDVKTKQPKHPNQKHATLPPKIMEPKKGAKRKMPGMSPKTPFSTSMVHGWEKNNQCVEYNVPGGFGCHCSSDISDILQVSYSKGIWEDRFPFPLVGYPTFWCGKCISGFCATQKKAIKSSFVRRSMAFHGQANICRTSV